jgi:ubiquinone/menaquinone biosynthesis C-methylase UbiE/DNA-binding transcriptional ArsR family regulator
MSNPLAIFRALADPTRLRIIALLRKMELSVGELAQVLGQSQPRVSRHVRILCDADLARRRKEGGWVFLVPASGAAVPAVFSAIDRLVETGGGDHWEVADAARLAAVHADRATAAQVYFAAHADDWDAIRSLHVAESEVEAAIVDLLGSKSMGVLVDIGTGTGRMIALLGSKVPQAIGIDRNPEMLRLARVKLSEADSTSWELRQGDVGALPLPSQSADTAILHQVLHYLPAPEIAIAEAARTLKGGGQLLVVDFAPHDREELRDRDAHTRLGFSDEQIAGWFAQSGLELTHTRELSGGALTVKLWLGERASESLLSVVA